MNIKKDRLNVLFSTDDNYAQHLGVAIYSLLDSNRDFPEVCIYVVDNEICRENKEKLFEIIKSFRGVQLHLIDFSKWKEQLNLNLQWDISISTYARLFISDMLPDEIDRVIYLDCDMIICESLAELWNVNLDSSVLAAVQDAVGNGIKTSVGLKPDHPYFNAGMLMINLAAWRKRHVGEECLDFLNKYNGSVTHHDQGVLNGVLFDKWKRVDLKFNLMTIHYIVDLNQINKYYQDHSEFYSEEEIAEAKDKPTIIHFTPSFTTRPWVINCKHPLKQKYWEALRCTPWKDEKPQADRSKWYIKIINWRYRNLHL